MKLKATQVKVTPKWKCTEKGAPVIPPSASLSKSPSTSASPPQSPPPSASHSPSACVSISNSLSPTPSTYRTSRSKSTPPSTFRSKSPNSSSQSTAPTSPLSILTLHKSNLPTPPHTHLESNTGMLHTPPLILSPLAKKTKIIQTSPIKSNVSTINFLYILYSKNSINFTAWI